MYHIDNKNNYEEYSLPEEREVDFWYVLPLAGQSNAMAYGKDYLFLIHWIVQTQNQAISAQSISHTGRKAL